MLRNMSVLLHLPIGDMPRLYTRNIYARNLKTSNYLSKKDAVVSIAQGISSS